MTQGESQEKGIIFSYIITRRIIKHNPFVRPIHAQAYMDKNHYTTILIKKQKNNT